MRAVGRSKSPHSPAPGGGTASIEGVVELKTMSEAERAHLADDAGKKIDEIPKNEVRIMASAVEVNR